MENISPLSLALVAHFQPNELFGITVHPWASASFAGERVIFTFRSETTPMLNASDFTPARGWLVAGCSVERDGEMAVVNVLTVKDR